MSWESLRRRASAVPAWGWLALALALRLAFALKLGSRYYQIDEVGFDAPAWNLARFGVIGEGERAVVFLPVPPAVFGAVYALLGHDMLYPRLLQAFLGALTAWLIGRMTEDLTESPQAGRAALAVSCVYPFFVYYNGVLLSETLYLLFVVPGLWLLCSRRLPPAPAWAAGGFLLALAGLTRIQGVPIAGLIWAGAGVACLAGRARWRDLGLALLCWALPLAGWSQRNKVLTGERALDTHGGVTLLTGTFAYEIDVTQGTDAAMKAVERMPAVIEAQSLPPAQRDAVYRKAALRHMAQNPGRTFLQWGKKLASFWRFYPRVDKAYYDSDYSKPAVGLSRAALVVISLLFEPWLIVGGLMGLWALRRTPRLYPIALFILGTTGIHMLVVSMMRYRLPVMPFLILGVCALAARAPRRPA